MSRTDRLYELAEELRAVAPEPRTISRLASRFDISERTVQRDLQALLSAGVPVRYEAGPKGGWFIDPEMTLPPIAFTVEELAAVAFSLAASGDETPFAEAARSAVTKLIATSIPVSGGTVPESPGRVLQLPDPIARRAGESVNPAVRLAVGRAVADRKVLRLSYADAKGQVSRREVEPSGMLAASGHWYLIGWCRTRQDGRGFRLDRIVGAEITDETAPNRDMAGLLGPLGRGAATPEVLNTIKH